MEPRGPVRPMSSSRRKPVALGGEGRGEIGGAAPAVNKSLHAPASGLGDDAPF